MSVDFHMWMATQAVATRSESSQVRRPPRSATSAASITLAGAATANSRMLNANTPATAEAISKPNLTGWWVIARAPSDRHQKLGGQGRHVAHVGRRKCEISGKQSKKGSR